MHSQLLILCLIMFSVIFLALIKDALAGALGLFSSARLAFTTSSFLLRLLRLLVLLLMVGDQMFFHFISGDDIGMFFALTILANVNLGWGTWVVVLTHSWSFFVNCTMVSLRSLVRVERRRVCAMCFSVVASSLSICAARAWLGVWDMGVWLRSLAECSISQDINGLENLCMK